MVLIHLSCFESPDQRTIWMTACDMCCGLRHLRKDSCLLSTLPHLDLGAIPASSRQGDGSRRAQTELPRLGWWHQRSKNQNEDDVPGVRHSEKCHLNVPPPLHPRAPAPPSGSPLSSASPDPFTSAPWASDISSHRHLTPAAKGCHRVGLGRGSENWQKRGHGHVISFPKTDFKRRNREKNKKVTIVRLCIVTWCQLYNVLLSPH